MAVDLSVFGKLKTKADFDREAEAWALAKREKLMGRIGQSPAAVQLANEIQKARASGDTQRMNDLYMSAKLMDRGVVTDENGNPVAMGGYGDAVGSIAGTKKAYETQGQKGVELVMNPQIAGGEAGARQAQELRYAQPIAYAKASGQANAEQIALLNKKANDANSNLGLINQARDILSKNKASGSGIGALIAAGKNIIGQSDEMTQANSALEVIGGNLVATVPRMEGPQSNYDVQNYKKMAGKVASRTTPAGDKMAALAEMERLANKYANINTPSKQALGVSPQREKEITIINPKTGEQLVIPESDFSAARKDGWMKK